MMCGFHTMPDVANGDGDVGHELARDSPEKGRQRQAEVAGQGIDDRLLRLAVVDGDGR